MDGATWVGGPAADGCCDHRPDLFKRHGSYKAFVKVNDQVQQCCRKTAFFLGLVFLTCQRITLRFGHYVAASLSQIHRIWRARLLSRQIFSQFLTRPRKSGSINGPLSPIGSNNCVFLVQSVNKPIIRAWIEIAAIRGVTPGCSISMLLANICSH